MASAMFLAALERAKETKSLDTMVSGSSYMEAGRHEVTIQVVDTDSVDDDRLSLVLVDAAGREHQERMFLMSSDGNSLSYGLRGLLAALIPDTSNIADFIDLVGEDNHAYEVFTGMKLAVVLKRGKGFEVRSIGGQTYAAFDTTSGEQLTEAFEEVKDAKETAKAAGLKQAWMRVDKFEATDVEANKAAFELAIEARKRS